MQQASVDHLLTAFADYRAARIPFLKELGCTSSNRDPLAEFSERLVAALTDGQLAKNRVQPEYDVIDPAGEKIQVKYLANASGKWGNEHHIKFSPNMDLYALAFFEDLRLIAILMFSKEGIEGVCQALHKRHPDQNRSLQVTQRNFQQIMSHREAFTMHGVQLLYCENPDSLHND